MRAGIHRTAYHRIESGTASPALDTVDLLAKALKCTSSELLRDPGIPLTDDPVFRMPRGSRKKVAGKKRRPAG